MQYVNDKRNAVIQQGAFIITCSVVTTLITVRHLLSVGIRGTVKLAGKIGNNANKPVMIS